MEQMARRQAAADRWGTSGPAWRIQEKRVGGEAYLVFALAVLLVYLVLAAQYESWLLPAGGDPGRAARRCWARWRRSRSAGMDNNIYTQIGIVLIIALASKNAILIVEFARELRRAGPVDRRGGGRGGAAAVPADPDDLVRVHPGRGAAGDRRRGAGRRQPAGAGHGRVRRHDRLDGAGRVLRAGVLRRRAGLERALGHARAVARSLPRAAPSRAWRASRSVPSPATLGSPPATLGNLSSQKSSS